MDHSKLGVSELLCPADRQSLHDSMFGSTHIHWSVHYNFIILLLCAHPRVHRRSQRGFLLGVPAIVQSGNTFVYISSNGSVQVSSSYVTAEACVSQSVYCLLLGWMIIPNRALIYTSLTAVQMLQRKFRSPSQMLCISTKSKLRNCIRTANIVFR